MPALAAVVVLSLGAGIGVNTVVFSWIEARLLKPLPGVAGSAMLLLVEPRNENGMFVGTSWLEYADLREGLGSLGDVLAFRTAPMYLGETGDVERVYGQFVSANYFDALDLQPAVGRFLRPDEVHRPGSEAVAVISYGVWQRRYRGRPDAIGQTVRVNGQRLTVVGVAPRRFQGTVMGLNFEVYVPATMAPVLVSGSRELDDRGIRGYSVMGRLRPDATRAQAQAQLDAIMTRLAVTYPATNATLRGNVLPFWQAPRGPQRLLAIALAVLQGFMLLLLLAVCGNTANLILARASTRLREMGVRLALGARPRLIVRLLLLESVALGVLGAMVAIPIAWWGISAFQLLPLTGLPIRFQTELDAGGLAFAIVLGILCGAILGAAPAVQLSRVDPLVALRAGARSAGRSRLRNVLMGIQVALALVVLIVAGLFFRSVMETRDTDPGFRREGVLLAAYDLTGRNAGAAFTRAFPECALRLLRERPGVEAAAISSAMPLDIHGLPSRVFTVEGHARVEPGFERALANTVTPGYFDLMNIPFRTGTDFAPLTDETAGPQVIVNDEFVRRYLAGLEPLGRRLQARGRTYVITGVVRNSLYNAFGEPPTAIIYFSYRDNPAPGGEIHARTRPGSEQSVAPEIRRAVSSIDPELPVFNVRTLNDHVETNLVFRRVPARMFAFLGPMLLVLAAIGIYAVVAYSVSQRTTEIGLRIAVGASEGRIAGQIVGETMAVAGLGALAGWSLALVVAMDVAGGTIDVPVFAGVPAILLTVAAIAAWLPVRRAARLDPVVALRNE
jgi:predicted permease